METGGGYGASRSNESWFILVQDADPTRWTSGHNNTRIRRIRLGLGCYRNQALR